MKIICDLSIESRIIEKALHNGNRTVLFYIFNLLYCTMKKFPIAWNFMKISQWLDSYKIRENAVLYFIYGENEAIIR